MARLQLWMVAYPLIRIETLTICTFTLYGRSLIMVRTATRFRNMPRGKEDAE